MGRDSLYGLLFVFLWIFSGATGLAAQGNHATYNKTKYPIVMVPGAFGFDSLLGGVDYWYGITDELRSRGAEVYVTNLSSSASHYQRGEELLEDIRNILALTGAKKLNLIAHSQGATAARYVASIKSEWIASVSCFNCMNEGTAFADSVEQQIFHKKILRGIVNLAMSSLFSALEFLSVSPKDGSYNSPQRRLQVAEELVKTASSNAYRDFNERFPEALAKVSCAQQNSGRSYERVGGDHIVNGVAYFSLGGTQVSTRSSDPIDQIILPIIKLFYPNDHVWDGFVPACGHPLGQLVESGYAINHFDAVNHSFGLVKSGVHVPTIYAIQVNRLKNEGY